MGAAPARAPIRTPQGMRPADFAAALAEFARVVGAQWVFTSAEDLDTYRDAYSPVRGLPEERLASAAVAPSSVEQVQEIVRIAARRRVPIYPISTGRNLGYGGSAPVWSGSVVLDLKRMNRIVKIDDRTGYCIVEPGVSYFELYRHIREKNLKVWIDIPDPGWGSLMGNALDHGVGETPLRDHFAAHCGMEVVLPSGELLRTGMGALPNASTWPYFQPGYGPIIDGIFSQSNFGVVTKMGFYLLPEPEAARLQCSVAIGRHEDLDAFVQQVSHLHDYRILNSKTAFASPVMSSRDPEAVALWDRPGNGSSAEWNAVGERLRLPMYRVTFNLYGPKKMLAASWNYIKEVFGRFAGASFDEGYYLETPFDPDTVPAQYRTSAGIPNLFLFGPSTAFNGANGHYFFAPAIPMTGEAMRKANEVFYNAYKEIGLRWPGWRGGNHWHARSSVILFNIQVVDDPAVNAKNVEAFNRLIDVGAEHGWCEYRTPPLFQDKVLAAYSFNDHALKRVYETLKDALDPAGVIAPGKCGIWPRHLRGARR